ncbi:MAG: response regulator [Prolixibacteraceae bacterium]|nr:response regulator [Prolixibacteraceae bacterium]
MRKGFLYIFFLFISTVVCGAVNDYQFKKLDVNNGISSNQINAIYKDSYGYLWIGTVNGLNRFDGYSPKVFRKNIDIKGSISGNLINNIFEDHRRRLIVNTGSGINIYDPVTEKFSVDDSVFHKNIEIPLTNITGIFTDKNKNLWVVNRNSGIYKYDPKKDLVSHCPVGNNNLMPFAITGYTVDAEGFIWLINNGPAIEKFDPVSFKVIRQFKNISSYLRYTDFDNSIYADKDGDLWIYSRDERCGAFLLDSKTGSIKEYRAGSEINRLSHNIITCIVEDQSGRILIGTDHGGLNVINKRTGDTKVVVNDPGDEKSLSQNSIVCMYKDDNDIIWIGTYKKGLNYTHPDLFKFATFSRQPFKKDWLDYEDINSFAEDRNGNLWLGSNGGGLIYFDRLNNTFKTYRHNPNDPNSISSNIIVDVFLDHSGDLWIGTYMGGLNRYDGSRFKHYMNDPNDPRSISSNQVWSIYEDSDRKLYIGTLGSGLDIYDRASDSFIHKKVSTSENSIHSNFVMSISENIDKNLWFATTNGVDYYNKSTGKFYQYYYSPDSSGISSNTVLDVYCDKRGLVWIATREGLNILDPKTGKFRLITEKNGLPDNNILTILEDNGGNMWVGTPQGLSNIILSDIKGDNFSFTLKNFDEKDGLHGKEFNEHSALKTRKGELIFGGADGFSIIKPENLKSAANIPTIVFAGIDLQNKPIESGEKINKRVLLPRSANFVNSISLKHFEKTFSISFAALNYFNPEKTQYHYKLEGFDNDWITTGPNSRKITYTNLHPGEYVFRVYASDIDNTIKSNEINLKIEVKPPFWKTKWALTFYLVFFLLAIFYTLQALVKRERNKFLIQQERIETARIHEMDMLKLKFFTNVSHEFRTPLTLILSPLERIIRTTENGQNKEQLKLIQRNGKRLLNLVNQLLDFRRLEQQGLSLLVREGELVGFCKDATESFSDLSESRNIKLTFTSNVGELKAKLDYDKIEKILFNLLSNAFKFTSEGGNVSVNLLMEEGKNEERQVILRVCDNGIGIPEDKQELIFERFVQSLPEGATVNKGSGIGLSLTKEFVQMHGGTISVKSKVGEGSCFEVNIPLKESYEVQKLAGGTVLIESDLSRKISVVVKEEMGESKGDIFKILLVEDNPDIRFYLKDNLKSDYFILEAVNGQEAWDIILQEMPDLIVSDIMMPVMDGLELCQKIKTDNRTSHTPVILLTAKTTDQQKFEGLETGADDYITKPFNFEMLELRIKTLIEQRHKLRQLYQQNFDLQPSEISITSLDEKFLRKIKTITENNMHEPNFSVEKLSSEFGISRAHLYNKLVALTGKTPIEFIRILRIRRAAQLLEKSQLTVMEIAYKVGFNDPRYFTKHFKSEYNMTPSQYAKKNFKGSDSSIEEI